MAKQVEQELEGEDDGETRVGPVQCLFEEGRRPIRPVDLVRLQLRLENRDAEILHTRQ